MIPGSIASGFNRTRGGYQISRSLRFNSADSAYLSRAFAAQGDLQKNTARMWVKRGNMNAERDLQCSRKDGNNYELLFFNSSNQLVWQFVSGGVLTFQLITSAVFRDPTAWLEVVARKDTTQATAANRLVLEVNGVTQALGTATYPAQNTNCAFGQSTGNGYTHYIGSYDGSTAFFDGYLADLVYLDGYNSAASTFSETSATTAAWNPKAFSVTYGTQGHWLKLADNSNTTATTLGKDSSGNGNNWTPNNLSVTAGAGNDSLTDTPTNYGTDTGAGGEVRGNYCVLNPVGLVYVASPTLANGGLDWSTSGTDCAAIGTLLMQSGKWYFEMTVNSFGGAQDFYLGIFKSSGIGATPYSSSSRLYYRDGRKYNGSLATYGNSYTTGDVIGVAVDMINGKVFFSKNGTWQNSGDPAAGTNAAFTDLAGSEWLPMGLAGSLTHSSTWNFGQRPFAYTAPSGFKALCTQNLADSAVVKPTTGFYVKTRNGTGATASVTSVPFAPDLYWGKERNGASDHAWFDVPRGATNGLRSSNTAAESADANSLTAFNSNGVTFGTNSSATFAVNRNTYTYVDWFWREGATYGFDIVLYTGNGSNRTIAHSLGAAPYYFTVKSRDTAATNWLVYHASLGATKYIVLQSVGASGTASSFWNDTAPTSSVFSLGTDGDVNGNTKTYVAYLWAPIAGFSAFTSYTGNGNADGPVVAMGMSPAFSLIKRTDVADNWMMYDAGRNPYNPINCELYAQLANAEGTSNNRGDYLAPGMKIRSTDSGLNTSSGTYIVAAFAQDNFKNARAR